MENIFFKVISLLVFYKQLNFDFPLFFLFRNLKKNKVNIEFMKLKNVNFDTTFKISQRIEFRLPSLPLPLQISIRENLYQVASSKNEILSPLKNF